MKYHEAIKNVNIANIFRRKNYLRRSSPHKVCLLIFLWSSIWIFYILKTNYEVMLSHSEKAPLLNHSSSKMDSLNEEGASACLIIKDDNPRLIEWIAYHYQILPLRRLIITSDPSAFTSPTEILERWRKIVADLEIIEWTEEDYEFDRTWAKLKARETKLGSDPSYVAEYELVARQRGFYSSCASYIKENGGTWVYIIDVDEYVVFNTIHEDDPTKSEELTKFLTMMKPLKRYRKRTNIWKTNHEDGLMNLRRKLPDIGSKSVMEFIKEIKDDPFSPFTKSPSYTMPRLFFSAQELKESEISRFDGLQGIDSTIRLDTLRFFKHAEKGAFPWNRYGKSMIDVSRIPIQHLKPFVHEHQGVGYNDDFESIFYSQSLLRIHHYLGSWEAYKRPDDDRRSKVDFERKAYVDHGIPLYDTIPWVDAFIENVGIVNAKALLEGSGDHRWKQAYW